MIASPMTPTMMTTTTTSTSTWTHPTKRGRYEQVTDYCIHNDVEDDDDTNMEWYTGEGRRRTCPPPTHSLWETTKMNNNLEYSSNKRRKTKKRNGGNTTNAWDLDHAMMDNCIDMTAVVADRTEELMPSSTRIRFQQQSTEIGRQRGNGNSWGSIPLSVKQKDEDDEQRYHLRTMVQSMKNAYLHAKVGNRNVMELWINHAKEHGTYLSSSSNRLAMEHRIAKIQHMIQHDVSQMHC